MFHSWMNPNVKAPSMTFSSITERPTYADIEVASERLRGLAVVTPLLESPLLNALIGGRLLIKAEPLQRTGSFKFRGAYNRISQLSSEERERGVVAYSSGNHAQGVAAAARAAGTPAVVVMPRDAPAIKIDNTRAWGAEVVLYERASESREARSREIAEERGMTLVPPFDDPLIIAGQGTVGRELADQAEAVDAKLDAVLSPCGGGGLVSGCATAIRARCPGTDVFAVEPEGFDDTARSLVSGIRERAQDDATSFCDALLAPTPGQLTFSINHDLLAGGLTASDDEVARAMRLALIYLKLVTEPGGAVALAAAVAGKYDCRGKTVGIIVSGGNVDPEVFGSALARAA
jgi:threonine dehydratase